ncbi:MAG: trypsin-like peptidase domain-containing protein [Solirubrobacterales bacterium]|nr:trypsin-like peptidase domain-containing protein [Solirubrobacterales bacterium]
MPKQPPLWFGRTEGDADHRWLESDQIVPPRVDPPAAAFAPPPRQGVRRRWFVAMAACLLVGGAGAGLLIAEDNQATSTIQALPIAAAGGVGSSQVNAIYSAVSSGVVQVRTDVGSGTGFVVDADGTIVTNAHVVGDATNVKVQFDDSNSTVDAKVVGRDLSSDLAVLHVDPARSPALKPLGLADSDKVKVGDLAVAIGYPLGLARTATSGIVSGIGRHIQAPNGFSIDKVIQTDAPINSGNSGGPLFDARGRVIGVNSQIATAGSQGNLGIGFAIPANTVRSIVPLLKDGQKIDRAFLGASSSPSPSGPGALIQTVTADGPAARAGLRSQDVIVAIDGRQIGDPDALIAIISTAKPGDRVELEIVRDGQRKSLSVELGTRPQGTP